MTSTGAQRMAVLIIAVVLLLVLALVDGRHSVCPPGQTMQLVSSDPPLARCVQ